MKDIHNKSQVTASFAGKETKGSPSKWFKQMIDDFDIASKQITKLYCGIQICSSHPPFIHFTFVHPIRFIFESLQNGLLFGPQF